MKQPTLNPETARQRFIAEIMQAGFDVAMGGDPFKSEEENANWQNSEYDKTVKRYAKELAKVEQRAIESEREFYLKHLFPSNGRYDCWRDGDIIIKKIHGKQELLSNKE